MQYICSLFANTLTCTLKICLEKLLYIAVIIIHAITFLRIQSEEEEKKMSYK